MIISFKRSDQNAISWDKIPSIVLKTSDEEEDENVI